MLSSSSAQYASVIKATADLQSDLSNALSTIRTLQHEKDYLTVSNQTLLNENQALRTETNQGNQRILQEQQQKIHIEKQYEKANQEWRKLLDDIHSKHLNELAQRTLITPEDMDQLRQYANTQEHRAIKTDILLKDLQTKYDNLQKELEITKRTAATAATIAAREAEITNETSTTIIKELRYTIEQHQQQTNQQETLYQNQIRELKATIEEMTAKTLAVTNEMEQVREDRDRLRHREQSHDIEKARELANTIAERRALETEKAVAERRAIGNAAEAASLRNALNESTARLATTATELQQVRNELSIKQRTMEEEIQTIRKKYTTEQLTWEKEKEELLLKYEDTVQRAITDARKQGDDRATRSEEAFVTLQEKYTLAEERIKELTNELHTLRSHVIGPSRPSSRLGGMNSNVGSRRGSVSNTTTTTTTHHHPHGTAERSRSGSLPLIETIDDSTGKTKSKPSSPVLIKSSSDNTVQDTPRQLVNEDTIVNASATIMGQSFVSSKHNLVHHHQHPSLFSQSLSTNTYPPPSSPSDRSATKPFTESGVNVGVTVSPYASSSSAIDIAYAEIASLNGEIQTLRYTVQDLRTTITALQVQLSRSMASITETTKQRTEAEQRTREAELQVSLLQGKIDNYEETIQQLHQDIVMLKETLQYDRSSHQAQQHTIHASYEQMLLNEQNQRKVTEEELTKVQLQLGTVQRKATAYKDRLLRLYEMYKLMKGHIQVTDPHLLINDV